MDPSLMGESPSVVPLEVLELELDQLELPAQKQSISQTCPQVKLLVPHHRESDQLLNNNWTQLRWPKLGGLPKQASHFWEKFWT